MPILFLIILATVLYTLYDVFASKASGGIDPNASATIFNGLGALIPLAVYAFLKMGKGDNLIPATKSGIVYSVLAGISIALFSIIFIKLFEKGNLSYVIPVIYGGTIVLASLLGIFLFKDKVSVLQTCGIVAITAGVIAVAISKLQ